MGKKNHESQPVSLEMMSLHGESLILKNGIILIQKQELRTFQLEHDCQERTNFDLGPMTDLNQLSCQRKKIKKKMQLDIEVSPPAMMGNDAGSAWEL